jgi:hypothetical protein
MGHGNLKEIQPGNVSSFDIKEWRARLAMNDDFNTPVRFTWLFEA